MSHFPLSTASQLVEAGFLEHERLGYRMADTFWSLFGSASLIDVSYVATSVARTVDSCKGFQLGFYTRMGLNVTQPIETRSRYSSSFIYVRLSTFAFQFCA